MTITPVAQRRLLSSALRDEDDIDHVTYEVRELAQAMGFDALDANLVAAATSELATNAVIHGGGGTVNISPTANDRGIEIVVSDDGPGIHDIDQAFVEGFSTRPGGLGLGLEAIRRATSELEVASTPGQGTTITARRFLAPPPEWLDVGVASAADPRSLTRSNVVHVRPTGGDAQLVTMISGLHAGPATSVTPAAVIDHIDRAFSNDPAAVLAEVENLVGLDGSAPPGMAIAVLHARRDVLTLATIGSFSIRAFAPDSTNPLLPMAPPAVSADAVQPRRVAVPAGARPLIVVMSSTGIAPDLFIDESAFDRPLGDVAADLLHEYRHPTGEASIAVIRLGA